MAMSGAERVKKYRKKLKKDKVKHNIVKAKARVLNNSVKTKLKGAALEKFRINSRNRQKLYRENKSSIIPSIVPKPTYQRTQVQLADKLKQSVYKFYVRDDISYQLPGKRDTIVVRDEYGGKSTHQKRVLIASIRETHGLFMLENVGVDIGGTAFALLKPGFVVPKAALAHRNCLCQHHENVYLLIKLLEKYVGGRACSSLQNLSDSLVCSTESEECMFGQCPLCTGNFKENIEDEITDKSAKVNYCQWTNENGRAEKKEFSGTVKEIVSLLNSKVAHFLFHVYVKRQQSKYFEKLKLEVSDEKVCIQVDFAENYGMKENDEIQSAHWSTKTLSIFTAYVWAESECFSYALPSNDISHDKFVVDSALKMILNDLKT
ncbi:unnamed protein product, partial [Didymodactylos carnosus]